MRGAVIASPTEVFRNVRRERSSGIIVNSSHKLTGPVLDFGSKNVFVADDSGRLSFVRDTGSTTGTCSGGGPLPCLGSNTITTGASSSITDGPIVDGSTGKVFAFAGGTSGTSVVQADTALTSGSNVTVTVGHASATQVHNGAFDNSYFVLEAPNLRVRVLRERSVVVVGFGPTSEPGTWFDSSIVMDYLGSSSHGGFHDTDARCVLQAAATFISSMWAELTATFGPQQLVTTKREMRALAEERAAKMFGE